jgi:hypothetical protein
MVFSCVQALGRLGNLPANTVGRRVFQLSQVCFALLKSSIACVVLKLFPVYSVYFNSKGARVDPAFLRVNPLPLKYFFTIATENFSLILSSFRPDSNDQQKQKSTRPNWMFALRIPAGFKFPNPVPSPDPNPNPFPFHIPSWLGL